MKCAIATVALVVANGCGATEKKADSADEAAADQAAWAGELKAGTSVCMTTNGVRYVLEDALTERQLEVAEDGLSAEVELEETGDSGAWELKYRAVGEKWESCKSDVDDRSVFLGECLGELGAQIGGGE